MSDPMMTVKGAALTVKKLSYRYARRLGACGVRAMDAEDVQSEIWIAWTIACSRFDASTGVPFTPYFLRGVQNRLNRVVNRESADAVMRGVSIDAEVADMSALHDRIANIDDVSQDDLVIEAQSRADAFARMSPMTGAVIKLLDAPPPELYRQLEGVHARSRHARSVGIPSTASRHITKSFVMDALCLTSDQRKLVNKELSKLVQR